MPSKWSFLREKFPDLPPDTAYRDRLLAQMEDYARLDLADLADYCNSFEAELSTLEADVKALKLRIEAAMQVIGDKMEEAHLDSVVMAGYRWSPAYEPYPSVTDREALRAWAQQYMPDNLNLHPSTLKTVVKEALDPDAGTFTLPPGVDIYVKRSFRRTKQ